MSGKPVDPARNAEIIRRRQAGQGPTAIARDMKITKNMVISVCRRAGLSVPRSVKRPQPKPLPRNNASAGFRGALGLAQAQDTGRADLLLRRFSWEQDA